MAFLVDFSINNDNSFANEEIVFNDTSFNGIVFIPSDEGFTKQELSTDNELVNINDPLFIDSIRGGNFFNNEITKYEWVTSNGKFSSGNIVEINNIKRNRFIHKFPTSGSNWVSLTIYSETFEYNGYAFRFKMTMIKDITVRSKFFKFMTNRIPNYENITSKAYEDLLIAAANYFERISNDVTEIYNFTDLEKIDPKFLEYWSSTFGHLEKYSKKIAGDISTEDFDSYDIFDKIKSGKASESEITRFRQFLLYSSELFKGKGTPENVEKFLKFFNVDSEVVELWTPNWGQILKGKKVENFVGYTDFPQNSLDLNFVNVRFVGNENEKCHFEKTNKSFVLDNYHQLQKIEYDTDEINDDGDYSYFGLHFSQVPKIISVVREDGRPLGNDTQNLTDLFDIVPGNSYYPLFLKIRNDILDFGDRFSINYRDANEELFTSSVISKKETIKNFDTVFTFKYNSIPQLNKDTNFRQPEKEVHFIFRGRKWDTDFYADFNEYYKVSVNGKRQIVTLSKIIENRKNNIVQQCLNLGDEDNIVHEKAIIKYTDENNYDFYEFKEDIFYDMKVSINGSLVSAWIRENEKFTTTKNSVESDVGDIPWGENPKTEWLCLFENINLEQRDKDVKSIDKDGEIISSYDYDPLLGYGFYGYGAKCSIVEFEVIQINNLDPDEVLLSTLQKELTVKPKYLEWQDKTLLKYNNYRNESDAFSLNIEDPFTNKNNYTLDDKQVNSLKFMFFDNAPTDEIISSRYTINFDKTWLNENFRTEEEVKNKILIPFSDQLGWFMVEQRAWNRDFYRNYFGGTETQLEVNSITQSTTAENGNKMVDIPGIFNYNLNRPLGKYRTEPFDDFSKLHREENKFEFSQRIKQYRFSDEDFRVRGIFEEVTPKSTVFPDLTPGSSVILPDGTTYNNKLFFPIVFNSTTGRRILGVRFKNCDDIDKVIERGAVEFSREVQIWGLFTFHVPREVNRFRPNREFSLRRDGSPQHETYKAYLPLGVLNRNIQNYSLPTEFMHQIDNSGITWITIDGVYIRIPREKLLWNENNDYLELEEENPWEEKINNLYSRYFLSADLNLATKLTDFEETFDEKELSTKYMMDLSVRKMLKRVESETGYDEKTFLDSDGNTLPEEDKLNLIWEEYQWWIPKEVWRKRDFLQLQLNESEDLVTGINWNEDVSAEKVFYGTKFGKKPRSLQFKITDGKINPNTMYYAQVTLRMNWSGYSENRLSRQLNDIELKNRPLSQREAENVVTVGGARSKYRNHIQAPVGECMTFLVPIAWYPEGEVSSKNLLSWGNYLKGANRSDREPTITLTPYGLHTWLINNSNEANSFINEISQDFIRQFGFVTSGWSLEDWNARFMDMVSIDFIAEKVPEDKYKLMEEYGFTTEYAPNNGAFAQINFNVGADLDWNVFDTLKMIPKGRSRYYFEIPRNVKPLRDWIEKVESIKLFNYILQERLVDFTNPNNFRLVNDILFEVFKGSQFKGRYFFDLFFEDDLFTTQVENFETDRDINWAVFESTGENEEEKYLLSKRRESTDLILTGSDRFYDIIRVDGRNCLRINENKTTTIFDPQKVGIETRGR